MNGRIGWKLVALVLAATMGTNAAAGEPDEPRDVRLAVTDSGHYILAGKPVALSDLRAKLRELKSDGGPINLHVAGGSKAEYRFVMPAMQIVQEEGLGKVGYIANWSCRRESASALPRTLACDRICNA